MTLNGAGYRGELTVLRGPGGLEVVNSLPLDRYLRGVVSAEMPNGWHAAAYYHASSGGRTAAAHDVWPNLAREPYLVSVLDPYDSISPYHRWGPLVATRDELARRLGAPLLRDVIVDRSDSGFASGVRIMGARTSRTITARAFADALGLRSTAFAVRVLALDAPRRPAPHDRPFSLAGFVRGLRGVRLEQRFGDGAWRTVARIRPRANGRFAALIHPRRTAWYRLATAEAAGAETRLPVA